MSSGVCLNVVYKLKQGCMKINAVQMITECDFGNLTKTFLIANDFIDDTFVP